jgi:hypothetical protein
MVPGRGRAELGLPPALAIPTGEGQQAGVDILADDGLEFPQEAYGWLTAELREMLARIPGPHERKKRRTAVVLAFSQAMQEPMRQVFRRHAERGICSERVWYQKWQYVPEIWSAYLACLARCLEFLDEDTVRIEEHFLRVRRRHKARYTAEVPVALASIMANPQERAGDRIEAALALYNLDEAAGGRSGRTVVEVQGVDGIDRALRDELARLQLIPAAPPAPGAGADPEGDS